MKGFHLCAWLFTAEIVMAGCGGSSMQPSGPGSSTLTFQVAAGALNPADSGSYTTATANFGASVQTCTPTPETAGKVCPDLGVFVRGTDGRQCVMWAFAPVGKPFAVGSYPNAGFSATAAAPGFFFNCGRGGTTCADSISSFTIHELQANSSRLVIRLHMTFEQTCLAGSPPNLGPFGKGTGELWIVNGSTPFS